jgi:hypothetical protein
VALTPWVNGEAGGTPLSAPRLNQLAPIDQVAAIVAYELGNPTSETTLALQAMFPAKDTIVVNVADHGAVGDGATDDTAAVQAAMDILRAFGGGTLFFPPREYLLLGAVELTSDVVLSGYGATISKVGATTTGVSFVGRSGTARGYGSGASRIAVRGLRFRGDFAAGKINCAFALHHADDVLVEDCAFDQCIIWGHTLDLQGCRRVTVRRSTWNGFYATHGSASPSAEAIQVDSSTLTGASYPDDPAGYDGLPTTDVVVEDCTFAPLTIGATTYPCPNPIGSHAQVEGMTYRRIVFRGNTVTRPHSDVASSYFGAIHFTGAEDVTIADNTFTTDNPSEIVAAINFYRGAFAFPLSSVGTPGATNILLGTPVTPKRIRVAGNRFSGFQTTATASGLVQVIGDASVDAEDVLVTGNVFTDNSADGGVSANGQDLVRVTRTARLTVEGNTFAKTRRALYAQNCSQVTMARNRVKNSAGAATFLESCNGITVEGNVYDTAALPIYTPSCTDGTITGNTIRTVIETTIAVQVRASSGVLVNNNRIWAGSSTIATGVRVDQSSTACQVRNNIITGFTTAVSVEAGSTADNGNNVTT